MLRILIESDHFLKSVPVLLDPETPEEHRRAVADFFAHDMPDFLAWCDAFRKEIPGLFPAQVIFGEDQRDFDAKLADADCAIVESFFVGEKALAQAKRLVAVHKFGTILSNIDLDVCGKRRIPVLPLRRVVNMAVAEQAFALMIALDRRIGQLNGVVTAERLAQAGYPIRPYDRRYSGGSNYARIPHLKTLNGAVLGIVGLGEVGRELASRANAFGMRVVYHQRTRLPPMEEMSYGARYLSLNELMAESDYIVVQLPLNNSTKGIVGREALRAVKPGAVLINIARAHLVDRDALIEALDSGKLGGLGMDVGYDEPWDPSDPLLKYKDGKVIVLPHTAIGDRRNGLEDLKTMCVGLWRAVTSRKR